ncbi:MAG: S1C family serine protease [Nitrososphaeraceae archaeon]
MAAYSHGTTRTRDRDDTLSAIFDKVSNSIVQIVSIAPLLFSLNLQARNMIEIGAGFIYNDAGHIVTANHVLAGANNVSLVFKDGDRYDANVVDRGAFKDSAVLKIVDNNNTSAQGIVRFSGDSIFGIISVNCLQKVNVSFRVYSYEPLMGYLW